MRSRTTRRFRALFAALPANIQRQAREAYRLFQRNPAHPGLHFKQVHLSPPIYSARVGIGYRAVGRHGNLVLDRDARRVRLVARTALRGGHVVAGSAV